MKLYSCKVRLGGSVVNEVRKDSVLAAEIMLLRGIHGGDAVLEVRLDGEDKSIKQEDAKARLMRDYVERSPEVARLFNALFPTVIMGGGDLPTQISSLELAEEEVKRPTSRVAQRVAEDAAA